MPRLTCLLEAIANPERTDLLLLGEIASATTTNLIFKDSTASLPCLILNAKSQYFTSKVLLIKYLIISNHSSDFKYIQIVYMVASDKLDDICSFHLSSNDLRYFRKNRQKSHLEVGFDRCEIGMMGISGFDL
jgi:aspartyl aminopeptidase